MAEFFIAVGSNIEPEKNLLRGLKLLTERAQVLRVSTHYRTSPVGGRRQPDFVNGVWHGTAEGTPQDFKALLREIEAECGRERGSDPYASRTLDLDLILWDNLQIDEEGLMLPAPEIKERAFVFAPLLELDPLIRLPGDHSNLSGQVSPEEDLYYSPVTEQLRNLLEKSTASRRTT